MNGKKVAVIGAGIMGCDLALDLARHNIDVILKDLSHEILQNAEQKIRQNFKFMKLMDKNFYSSSIEKLLSRITFTINYEDFEKIDIVLENITENYEIKKNLFTELGDVCQEETIYGSNTSCISITKLGSHLPKPSKMVGMHFLNPVPLKKLVEVIKGFHTSDDTIAKTKDFLESFDKSWVIVEDFPGFVTNRVLMLTINECIWVVQDKVAESKDVDKIFTFGFGHKMGPLATADLIGLDTILNSLVVLFESYNDPKYRPCPLLKKMVDAGLLGKKSGEGFYKY